MVEERFWKKLVFINIHILYIMFYCFLYILNWIPKLKKARYYLTLIFWYFLIEKYPYFQLCINNVYLIIFTKLNNYISNMSNIPVNVVHRSRWICVLNIKKNTYIKNGPSGSFLFSEIFFYFLNNSCSN